MDTVHSGHAVGGIMAIDDRFGHRGGIIHVFYPESFK